MNFGTTAGCNNKFNGEMIVDNTWLGEMCEFPISLGERMKMGIRQGEILTNYLGRVFVGPWDPWDPIW